MNIKSEYDLQESAFGKIKEIVSKMSGITEEQFYVRYQNDTEFRSGVKVLTQMSLRVVENFSPQLEIALPLKKDMITNEGIEKLKSKFFEDTGIPKKHLKDDSYPTKVATKSNLKSYIDKPDGSSRVSTVHKDNVVELIEVLKHFGHRIENIRHLDHQMREVRYVRRDQ